MSIRKLARSLDLSITTVSRALAGYPDVKEATREKVRAAAQAAGYRPNASARSLKLGRADAVGLIVPNTSRGDPFLSEFVAGLGAALAARDLDLLVTAAAPGEAELAAIRRVHDARKVDGFIVPRTRWHDPRVDLLLDLGVPFVCHGRTERARDHAWLDIDGEAAFVRATERLLSLGHRRIGFIGAPEQFTYARHRREGYRKALAQAGIAADEAPVVVAERAAIEDGTAAAARLLALPSPPTAILAATDMLAFGALSAIRAAGLGVSSDVSVIGYDDLAMAAHTVPPLTTMRQAIVDEGRTLVELLLGRIGGKPVEQLQVLRQAELVVRGSDGAPRS
jgi:LacI family transcriptional regulator